MEQDVTNKGEKVVEAPIEVTEEEAKPKLERPKVEHKVEHKPTLKPTIPVRPVIPTPAIQTQGVPNV